MSAPSAAQKAKLKRLEATRKRLAIELIAAQEQRDNALRDVANFKAAIIACVDMAFVEVNAAYAEVGVAELDSMKNLVKILEGIKQSATVVIG